jgi:hypothetical protein
MRPRYQLEQVQILISSEVICKLHNNGAGQSRCKASKPSTVFVTLRKPSQNDCTGYLIHTLQAIYPPFHPQYVVDNSTSKTIFGV